MSTKSVCEMTCGAMHEFALSLDKAGFNAELVQEIISSRGNAKAKAMFEVVKPASQKPAEKFSLLVDLGTITVSDGYAHENRLEMFRKQNHEKFYYYNDNITDTNFPNPSRILKPGDKLRVRVFQQIVRGSTSSEERMAFLATQNAIHLGAQGASLVFEQKRDQLPKGKWYVSFDEKEKLWKDAVGDRRVPYVDAVSVGDFRFSLGYFEDGWHDGNAFFCFCDE